MRTDITEVAERKLDGRNVRKQTPATLAAAQHESFTDLVVSIWKQERRWANENAR